MRAAVCQMNAGGADVERNVATAVRLLEEAAEGDADLAALPELWPFYGSHRRMRELAGSVPGELTEPLSAVAREKEMWVLGGSVPEVDDDGRVFNTSCLFDRDGELVARYRKIHLFDVDLPGQPPLRESAAFAEGSELVTHQTDLGRVGLSICYDLRFPELYRGLMALGAEVLLVPAAFTRATGEAHWEVLLARPRDRGPVLRRRAGAVGRVGAAGGRPPDPRALDDRRSLGSACSPRRRATATASGSPTSTRPSFARVRTVLPALAHRRLGSIC